MSIKCALTLPLKTIRDSIQPSVLTFAIASNIGEKAEVYIPQRFAPEETYQFVWSTRVVLNPIPDCFFTS